MIFAIDEKLAGQKMFTVTYTGKRSGTMSIRFSDARKALRAYRQMQADGATSLSVTDNRVHEQIDLSVLEKRAKEEGEKD